MKQFSEYSQDESPAMNSKNKHKKYRMDDDDPFPNKQVTLSKSITEMTSKEVLLSFMEKKKLHNSQPMGNFSLVNNDKIKEDHSMEASSMQNTPIKEKT